MDDTEHKERVYEYMVKKTLLTMEHNLKRVANQHYLAIGISQEHKKRFFDDIPKKIISDTKISKNWLYVILQADDRISCPATFWSSVFFDLYYMQDRKKIEKEIYKSCMSLKRLMQYDASSFIYDKAIDNLCTISKKYKKKILLLIDDFDVLLEKRLKLRDGWGIRYVLMNRPEIMLVGIASLKSPALKDYDAPLYGMFGYLNFSIPPL